jgi:hypothetical protein
MRAHADIGWVIARAATSALCFMAPLSPRAIA